MAKPEIANETQRHVVIEREERRNKLGKNDSNITNVCSRKTNLWLYSFGFSMYYD